MGGVRGESGGEDFPHLSRSKKGECASCHVSACSLCFMNAMFVNFHPVRCFMPQKSAYSRRRFVFVYIYKIYIYTWFCL